MVYTALLIGLLGSFHCIGMCGPIAFLLPLDRNSNIKKLIQLSLYHFGRLFAYALIGLLFGLLGKSFQLFGLQQQLSIIIGALMLLGVLVPQKKIKKYGLTKPIYIGISKLKNALGAQFKQHSIDTYITIGFLNGLLPCGLVYMAVFGAIASGNALGGSLYMLAFGLGTIPLMTTVIYGGQFLKQNLKNKVRKAIPVFLVIIGFVFIFRGLGLGIPYLSPKVKTNVVEATQNCNLDLVNN